MISCSACPALLGACPLEWCPAPLAPWSNRRRDSEKRSRMGRQEQLEGGALGSVQKLEPAAVALHDILAHRQPQAGSLTHRLGGEEGLKDAVADFRGDAGSVVGDPEVD